MSAGGVTSRVYDALKREVMSGRLTPGTRLDPAKLADTLASSTTPVRDALYRLAGERLVETRLSEGFFLPVLHEPALRELYSWSAGLFRLVTERWPIATDQARSQSTPEDNHEARTRAFFEWSAALTHHREYMLQVGSVNDRLAPARHAEARVLTELDAEIALLAAALSATDRRTAARLGASYHRRRQRAAPVILAALYRP